jgi:two-component system, sensor histidine kinase and response regulator
MNNHESILIIDDDEVVRESCAFILAKQNYRIQTAPDGDTGLKLAEEFNPGLVFVDLKMPGISGMEVLERLQQLDATIIPVVITGYASIDTAVEAMKRGAYDFLPKPFSADELRLITKRGLEKRRLLLEAIALRREKEIIRENFTSIVSHELRSPLFAVQQTLYAFLSDLADELAPGKMEMLEKIRGRVDGILDLINTWMEMTSADFSQLKERFRPVDILRLLSKTREMLNARADSKNVQLVTHCPFSVEPVNGDEETLLEVFLNIIGNAIKYSEADSCVSITIEDGDHELRVSVSDTGVGIEKEDIPFIFDDFYRGKAQNKAGELGSGLGLAISKRIMHAHGGSIAVESERGTGSKFTVTLSRG